MISGWTASNITAAASWSQQYDTKTDQSNSTQSTNSTDSSENKSAENPEWEKARQALAKVAGTSPQKAPKQNPAQNANNNVANPAAVPPYGQYYQPYGYQGYPYPPPRPQFNAYGYNAPTYPYFQQNGSQARPAMPYQPYAQHQGPRQETPKSESPSTQSQLTDGESRRQTDNTNNQAPGPSRPGAYNRQFQSASGPARNAFQTRMDNEDQENRDFKSTNGQGMSDNGPQGGPSYANAVKGGQTNTFWRQPQRTLPRPWSDGNSENHKFQTKRFKPAFESPGPAPVEHHEQNGSYSVNSGRTSPFSSQKPASPKHIVNEERNERNSPKDNESQNDINAQDWPPNLRDYVQRAFSPSRCITEEDKDEVETALKRMLTRVFEEKKTNSINWDEEPLPRLKSESKDDLPRWHPSRRYQSPIRRSPPKRHSSPPSWRKRGRSRSQSRSRSRSPTPPNSHNNVRGRLGVKNNTQKNTPKQKLKTPKGGKGKKGKKTGPVLGELYVDPENDKKINKRAQRFQSSNEYSNRSNPSIINSLNANLFIDKDEEELDWSKFHVVGTCQELKKHYYRLTTAPDPSTVRPKEVLGKSLKMIKDHWKANQDDYRYVCAQFKSIRQDLTVQGIRDEFTVEVYETHARIALEKGDREEFNQCQTQLRALYDNGVPGNVIEFTSYRLLYHLLTNSVLDYSTDLLKLKKEEKQTLPIQHALRLCSAWALSNYHSFFKLYLCAPNMSAYLIDLFVKTERVAAIKAIIKSWVHFVHICRMILDLLQYLTKNVEIGNIEIEKEFLTFKIHVC